MTVIFTASSDTHSHERSSRFITPLLYWLFPHITTETVDWVVFIARKCAHLIEYAVLALLLWHALHKPVKNDPQPWSWREVKVVLLVVFLYAATDEIHQIFVFSRTPQAHDVALDTLGGVAGLFVLWLIDRWQRHRRNLP